ncbi:interleukin-1 receptor-associated kinase 1 [Rhinoraja longicauda]
MSEWSRRPAPAADYIHRLPAYIMHEFCAVMDSLDNGDWGRFASSVVSDVTDLRLMENRGEPGRTQKVMWYWMNRNGTVGQLVDLLASLNLWRPQAIILQWTPPPPCPRPSLAPALAVPPCLPAAGSWPTPAAPSTGTSFEKNINGRLSERETVTIDSPEPKNDLPRPPTPPDSLFTVPGKEAEVSGRELPPPVTSNVIYWPLSELRAGTRNFAADRKLGEGGFGCVYRGLMRHTEFAVKRLKEDSDLDWRTVQESFYTELEKLYLYRHPNIMELAGCCVEDGIYCLVYNYMPNGSLQERLQCQGGTAPLPWLRRLEVALGTARAIQFLHGCRPSLIHGDVKSSNILLDEHFVAKLGDFGLARFSRYSCRREGSCTVGSTRTLRGTLAYLPDEYIKCGQLAHELDTYSFGVVLLEILTGRKALENDGPAKSKFLKDVIEEEEEEEDEEEQRAGKAGQQVAARVCRKHLDLRAGPCPPDLPPRLCALASECLSRKRKRRPKMTRVYEKLEEMRDSLRLATGRESALPVSLETGLAVTGLAERLQRSSLNPTENSYCESPRPGPHLSSDPLSPAPSLCSSDSLRPAPSLSALRHWECRAGGDAGYSGTYTPSPSSSSSSSSSRSITGPRHPVESDESSTDHGGGAVCRRQIRLPDGVAVLGDHRRSSVSPSSLSADSQASSLPSLSIVVNHAKQKILQQLALYNAGEIDSSELLSSTPRPESWSGACRRAPEESDEFD